MRAIPATLAAACLALAAAAAAQPAKPVRVALVIGNADYKDAPLANPTRDAADMAQALEAGGFKVIRRDNASLREMHLALREFGDNLTRNATGVFYFAGHGMQVRGRNYLIPVGADIAREDEVAFAALDLAAVIDKLDSARNPVNVVILDACRNNPFAGRFQASARGLAQVEAPPGTLIAFATAPGSVAADGQGDNGLYTKHLAREMRKPGAAVEEVFKSVRAAVRRESNGQQVPWESTSLESPFAFVPAPRVAATAPTASRSARPAAANPLGPPTYAVGDEWTYRVRNLLDASERNWTIRVTEVLPDRVKVSNGMVMDPAGNILLSVSSNPPSAYSPAAAFYFFPMNPGATVSHKEVQQQGQRTFDIDATVSILAQEEIDTEVVKLRTFRMERKAHWQLRKGKSSGTSTWTYWYYPGAKRYVVGEHRNVTSAGKVLLHERLEILTFAVK